jgi:hypothetical protein
MLCEAFRTENRIASLSSLFFYHRCRKRQLNEWWRLGHSLVCNVKCIKLQWQIKRKSSIYLPSLLPLSESVQHVFYHVVIKIRQLYLRPAASLTPNLRKTGVGANDCNCNRDKNEKVPINIHKKKLKSLANFS